MPDEFLRHFQVHAVLSDCSSWVRVLWREFRSPEKELEQLESRDEMPALSHRVFCEF